MKKHITPVQLAMLYTGSFLGAGFLSGQELLQFFGQFGLWGLAGMVLTIAAFGVFSWMSLSIAKRTGHLEFDKIILRQDNKPLRLFFSAVFLIFLFGCTMGMIAGAGALLEQMFGIPALAGDLAMTLLVLAVAAAGAAGLVAAFDLVVPLLVAAAAVIGVLAVFRFPMDAIPALPVSDGNPLLGNWLFSALSFLSYNMMAAITILVPLTRDLEDESTIRQGLLLGSGVLTVIFVCILMPMLWFKSLVGEAELPMLALASRLLSVLGVIYALLLLAGMFTAALSCLFGITARMEARRGSPLPRWQLAALCAAAFAGSIFGFKNVVSYVYPVCGYVGFFALLGVAAHYRFLQKNGLDNRQLSH